MRFQVPQFINVEDRILGSFTIKQFVYLVGGAGMVYIAFNFLPLFLSIPLIGLVVGFALALAFFRPNGKPFIFMVQAAISYLLSGRLYIWKRTAKKLEARSATPEEKGAAIPSLNESRLKDLTWALDINQNVKSEARSTKR